MNDLIEKNLARSILPLLRGSHGLLKKARKKIEMGNLSGVKKGNWKIDFLE